MQKSHCNPSVLEYVYILITVDTELKALLGLSPRLTNLHHHASFIFRSLSLLFLLAPISFPLFLPSSPLISPVFIFYHIFFLFFLPYPASLRSFPSSLPPHPPISSSFFPSIIILSYILRHSLLPSPHSCSHSLYLNSLNPVKAFDF